MNHKQKAKDIAAGIYITQASLANAIASALDEAYKQGVEATDDQNLDGTDAAHPAWWRGNDQGCRRTAERLQKALDGMDDGTGVISSPEIEKARRDILNLKSQLQAEGEKERERLKSEIEQMRQGYPAQCPFTGLPFFMEITHPELGTVPTYGGPFDSYTIPERVTGDDDDQPFMRHRFDHDQGCWVECEGIGLMVIHTEEHSQLLTERDQLKAELERVTNEFQRAKERALIRHLQAICEKCGGHKVNDLCVDCQLDQIDLMRDEFTRIKALTLSAEIAELCDRAITQTEQNTPVLVRLDDTERERDTARRQLREALTLLNKSTSALQHSCDCNQTPLACVCLVGEICEFLARQKGETK